MFERINSALHCVPFLISCLRVFAGVKVLDAVEVVVLSQPFSPSLL